MEFILYSIQLGHVTGRWGRGVAVCIVVATKDIPLLVVVVVVVAVLLYVAIIIL